MKKIEDYTTDELSAKIEEIKAERERTANALKRYEEELKRRKPEVPLGVPSSNRVRRYYCVAAYGHINDSIDENDCMDKRLFEIMNYFSSKESAEKHAEMLLSWRKDGLVANAKGEPIDIKVLLPLLPKGWVAMDSDKEWFGFESKPRQTKSFWDFEKDWCNKICDFNIKPAENWETSLMECGL